MKNIIFTLILLSGLQAKAQDSLLKISVKEVMNLPVVRTEDGTGVASVAGSQIVKESPAIITVISEADIRDWGARDLIDVLRQVPGFEITNDYGNIRAIGLRGNWASEGKVLLLIDGHQLNETSYGFSIVGQRFPVELIEKIEIIRGGGSSVYGGLAGLSVIKITTKKAKRQLFKISNRTEFSENVLMSQRTDFFIGKKWNNGLTISMLGSSGKSTMHNRTVTGRDKRTLNFADSGRVDELFLKIGAKYKNLNISLLAEDYRVARLGKDRLKGKTSLNNGLYFSADYLWQITPKLQFLPSFNWKQQAPWNNITDGSQDRFRQTHFQTRADAKFFYRQSDRLDFTFGAEYLQLDAGYNNRTDADVFYFYNGKKDFTLYNAAFFGEVSLKTKWTNVVVGVRNDNHNVAGSVFVPRFSLTKKFDKWHYKVVFYRSFRLPSIYNVDLGLNIRPEKIDATEIELGYEFSPNFSVWGNAYDMAIQDNLIYFADTTHNYLGSYQNYEKSGTRGFELGADYKSTKFSFSANYSHYVPTVFAIQDFLIEDRKDVYQGMPAHKLAFAGRAPLYKTLSLTASWVFTSSKYNYVSDAESDTGLSLDAAGPLNLLNIQLIYRDFLLRNLTLSLGVYNALNEQYDYGAGYSTYRPSLPAAARSFELKLVYRAL